MRGSSKPRADGYCNARVSYNKRIISPAHTRFLRLQAAQASYVLRIRPAFCALSSNRSLSSTLMHDQLEPDRLTRRNNDLLRLTADTHYRIAAGGHVEDGVSKIIS